MSPVTVQTATYFSFVWKLLLNDLDSFFENTYNMIWNTQEENEHLYSNFKILFEELITIIIPSIIVTIQHLLKLNKIFIL